jgi:hypothetical protein
MIRYSIRDILLFITIVGLSLGWCIDHRNQSKREQEEAAETLRWKSLCKIQVVNYEWMLTRLGVEIIRNEEGSDSFVGTTFKMPDGKSHESELRGGKKGAGSNGT